MTVQWRPWHEGAQQLLALGHSQREVARRLHVSRDSVRRFANPELAEKARQASRLRIAKRDPIAERLRKAANNTRWRLRRLAREEARERGEPYEIIYERWDVL
jgi:transposase